MLPTCRLSHSSRSSNRDTPGSARNVLHLGALSVPSRIGGERITRTYLKKRDSLVCDFWCTCVVTFTPIHRLASILLLLLLCLNFLCQVGSANGNPSGSLLGNRSRKPIWIFTGDDSSDEQGFSNFPSLVQSSGNKGYISKTKLRDDAPPALGPAGQPDALHWEPIGPQGTASFWERSEAPLPPLRPRCNFIHTRQLSPFPERLKLPFSSDEI